MAELLKDRFFQLDFLQKLARAIQPIYPAFEEKAFLANVHDKTWQGLELKARMRHISVCLGKMLPTDYEDAIHILTKIADQFTGFDGMIFPDFVELFGLNHSETSIKVLAYFTQFSSAEFAIRPFILKYESDVMAQMRLWAEDDNHHVRRLASEGCRPRLPWAIALPRFKQNPALILPILEQLKADESDYVRRSVANNLNDIAKDNPDTVLRTAQNWYGNHRHTDWIVKHACRTLLKKGVPEALQIFGFDADKSLETEAFTMGTNRIKIGSETTFSCKATALRAGKIRLEYKINYQKSTGKTSPKVFQISEKEYEAGEAVAITRKIAFKDLTTRKHYAGAHQLSLVVNGVVVETLDFELYE
jgi:3-methyladenine DNA glycosylase AlkC